MTAADPSIRVRGPLLFGLDGSREFTAQVAGALGVEPAAHEDIEPVGAGCEQGLLGRTQVAHRAWREAVCRRVRTRLLRSTSRANAAR